MTTPDIDAGVGADRNAPLMIAWVNRDSHPTSRMSRPARESRPQRSRMSVSTARRFFPVHAESLDLSALLVSEIGGFQSLQHSGRV